MYPGGAGDRPPYDAALGCSSRVERVTGSTQRWAVDGVACR
jgi:hypothetical protein